MTKATLSRLLTWLIAAVWLINGLYCKVLGMVPRHEAIVGRILGETHAHALTVAIGLAEIGMAIWIWSGWRQRTQTIVQIAVVATMNILEFALVPDLLLWGHLNLLFACLFIGLVLKTGFKSTGM